MNYELAKELRDAGFRQSGEGKFHETEEGRESREEMSSLDSMGTYLTQMVYSPTLSELIEECGDNFELLAVQPTGEKYRADSWPWGSKKMNVEGHGATCEEAVARLWLALDKNP